MKIDSRQEHKSPPTTRILPLKIDSKHHCHSYQGCDVGTYDCYTSKFEIICEFIGAIKICLPTTKTVCGNPSTMKIDEKWLHTHPVSLPGSSVTCYNSLCTTKYTFSSINNTRSDQAYE